MGLLTFRKARLIMITKEGLGEQEAQFLFFSQTIKITGLLILRRLHFFGQISTTSESDLALHSGCSVATIKRYLVKLRALGFVEIKSRRTDQSGNWLPNKYFLQPLALKYLQLFAPQLNCAPQFSKANTEKNSGSKVSYGTMEVRTIRGLPYEFVRKNSGKSQEVIPGNFLSETTYKPLKMLDFLHDRGSGRIFQNNQQGY